MGKALRLSHCRENGNCTDPGCRALRRQEDYRLVCGVCSERQSAICDACHTPRADELSVGGRNRGTSVFFHSQGYFCLLRHRATVEWYNIKHGPTLERALPLARSLRRCSLVWFSKPQTHR